MDWTLSISVYLKINNLWKVYIHIFSLSSKNWRFHLSYLIFYGNQIGNILSNEHKVLMIKQSQNALFKVAINWQKYSLFSLWKFAFIRNLQFCTNISKLTVLILFLQCEWNKLSRNHLLLTVSWINETSDKINAIWII